MNSQESDKREKDGLQPLTVLNVDDNMANRYVVSRTLRNAGFEVEEATSGQQALDLAKNHPSIILLDVNLPDINGFEVCKTLKSDPDLSSIPVVHLTASFATTSSKVIGLEGGADGYLTRPVDTHELLATIHAVLRSREAEKVAVQMSQEWQSTFDAIVDAACLLDYNGNILRCNKSMAVLLNADPESIYGQPLQPLLDAVLGLVQMPPVEELRKNAGRAEFEHRSQDRWYRITSDPVVSAEGKITGSVIMVSDVTEVRRVSRELAEKQAHVLELNERLRRGMRETHHRVKNNLQVIAAMVDMQIMEDTVTVPTSELHRLGAHIKTLAAIHDLLTEHAKEDDSVEWVSARMVLERLLPFLRQVAMNREIHFELEDALLSVRQATSLALITNEVVSNAIKHGKGDVDLEFVVKEGSASMRVYDDGPGFPVGFDVWQHANTGLELVNNLSRWDLGGDVAYGNRPEGGAVVTVTMPVAEILMP